MSLIPGGIPAEPRAKAYPFCDGEIEIENKPLVSSSGPVHLPPPFPPPRPPSRLDWPPQKKQHQGPLASHPTHGYLLAAGHHGIASVSCFSLLSSASWTRFFLPSPAPLPTICGSSLSSPSRGGESFRLSQPPVESPSARDLPQSSSAKP